MKHGQKKNPNSQHEEGSAACELRKLSRNSWRRVRKHQEMFHVERQMGSYSKQGLGCLVQSMNETKGSIMTLQYFLKIK